VARPEPPAMGVVARTTLVPTTPLRASGRATC